MDKTSYEGVINDLATNAVDAILGHKMTKFEEGIRRMLNEATFKLENAEEGNADNDTIQGLAGRCNGIRDSLKLFEKLSKTDDKEPSIKKYELAVLWDDGTWEDGFFQQAKTEEEATNAMIRIIASGGTTAAHVTVVCEQDDNGEDDDENEEEDKEV